MRFIQIFFVTLLLEVATVLILSSFPAYLPAGAIFLWATIIGAIATLFYYLKKVLHAKKTITIMLLGFIVFIPIAFFLALLFIGFGKASSLGYKVDTMQSLLTGALFIIFPITLPLGISILYWIFNKN